MIIHIKWGNTIKNIKLLKKDIYVDDNDKYLTGPVTICENLDTQTNAIQTNIKPTGNTDTEKTHKQLPSLSEIQKMRESALR